MEWFNSYPNSLIIVALISVSVLGCKSESTSSVTEEIPLGLFEGKVGESTNNGLYEELGGYSYFYINEQEGVIELALESSVVSSEQMTYVFLFMESDGLPSTGTYSFEDIEDLDQLIGPNFTGIYLSPIVGSGEVYYSESGAIEIEDISDEGIRGTIQGIFFYKVSTESDTYSRIYTTIEATFNAPFSNESKYDQFLESNSKTSAPS